MFLRGDKRQDTRSVSLALDANNERTAFVHSAENVRAVCRPAQLIKIIISVSKFGLLVMRNSPKPGSLKCENEKSYCNITVVL